MEAISKEVINLLPKSFAIKCDLDHPMWEKYIEFINSFGGCWSGDAVNLHYGLQYFDSMRNHLPITEHSLSDEITLLTMDELLERIDSEMQIEKVTTYDGEEHPKYKCVQIHEDSPNHAGEWALSSECKYARYNSGYALNDDVLMVNNGLYVIEGTEEYHDIAWSEFEGEYLDTNEDVRHGLIAFRGRNIEDWFITTSETKEIDGEYYRNFEAIQNAGYQWSERQEEWIHEENWESGYHDWDDDESNGDANNADYHDLSRKTRFDSSAKFTIGFEIEKEDCDMVDVDYYSLYSDTGWIKERDGSLDDDTGYELVTPAFNLFDDELDKDIANNATLRNLINASYSTSCGGHINIGSSIYNTEQLFEGLSGFFPLFYAMYEGRITKSYSKAKKKHEYYNKDKYSSIFIKHNVVEIRIPSAVINVTNLLWRRDLIRIMVDNINKSEHQVLRMLLNTKSKLHVHLRKVYSLEKLIDKIEKFIRYSEEFNNKKLPSVNSSRLLDRKSLAA